MKKRIENLIRAAAQHRPTIYKVGQSCVSALILLLSIEFTLTASAVTVIFPTGQMTGQELNNTITIKYNGQYLATNHTLYAALKIDCKPINGTATTNLLAGIYDCTISGIPKTFTINVTNTTETLNAVDIMVTPTNNTSANSYAWPISISDARYLQFPEAPEINDVLTWDGSAWIAAAASGGSADLAAATNNDVLSSNGVFTAATTYADATKLGKQSSIDITNVQGYGSLDLHWNMMTNVTTYNMNVASSNAATMYGTTVSGTNGNNWVLITDTTGTNFSRFGLGDTIIMTGGGQYLISGITNGNHTLSVTYNLGESHTNRTFEWFRAPLTFDDTVPRRTAMFTGGPGIGIAGFSIGNDGGNPGGLWFLDGAYTTLLANNRPIGSSPAYFAISAGLGSSGVGHANQFIIEDGSLFADFVIKANDEIAIRGGITNPFTSTITLRNTTTAPQVDAGMYRSFGTNTFALTGFSSTNGNTFAALDSGVFSQVSRFDKLSIGGEGYYIVNITNANNTVSVWPSISANHTNSAFTVTRPAYVARSTAGTIYAATSGDGNILLNQGLSANNGKLVFADGTNTTVLGNSISANPAYFYISLGTEPGGYGNQFLIQKGSLYNNIVILADNTTGIRDGLTNIFGNPLKLYGKVEAPTSFKIAGNATNAANLYLPGTVGSLKRLLTTDPDNGGLVEVNNGVTFGGSGGDITATSFSGDGSALTGLFPASLTNTFAINLKKYADNSVTNAPNVAGGHFASATFDSGTDTTFNGGLVVPALTTSLAIFGADHTLAGVSMAGGDTTKFFRMDGTFAVPAGGSTPTGTGFTHVTAGVQDAAAIIDGGTLTNIDTVLAYSTASISNSTTVETIMWSNYFAASPLTKPGQKITIFSGGMNDATSGATRTFKLYINGTAAVTIGATSGVGTGNRWTVSGDLRYFGNTLQYWKVELEEGAAVNQSYFAAARTTENTATAFSVSMTVQSSLGSGVTTNEVYSILGNKP